MCMCIHHESLQSEHHTEGLVLLSHYKCSHLVYMYMAYTQMSRLLQPCNNVVTVFQQPGSIVHTKFLSASKSPGVAIQDVTACMYMYMYMYMYRSFGKCPYIHDIFTPQENLTYLHQKRTGKDKISFLIMKKKAFLSSWYRKCSTNLTLKISRAWE